MVSNRFWYVEGEVTAYAAQKPIEFPSDAGAGRRPIFGGKFYAGDARPQSSNGTPDPNLL